MKLLTMLNISVQEFDNVSVILAQPAHSKNFHVYIHTEGIMTVSLSIIFRAKGDEEKKKLA